MEQVLPGQTSASLAQSPATEASDGSMEAPPVLSPPPQEDSLCQSQLEIMEAAQSNDQPTQNDQSNEVDTDEHDLSKNAASTPELNTVADDNQPPLHSMSSSPQKHNDQPPPQDVGRIGADETPASSEHDEKVKTVVSDAASSSWATEDEFSEEGEEAKVGKSFRHKIARPGHIPDSVAFRPTPHLPGASRGVSSRDSLYSDPSPPASYYGSSLPRVLPDTYRPASRTKSSRRPRQSSMPVDDTAQIMASKAPAGNYSHSPYSPWYTADPGLRPPTDNGAIPKPPTKMPRPTRPYHHLPVSRPRSLVDRFGSQPRQYQSDIYSEEGWDDDDSLEVEFDGVPEEHFASSLKAGLNHVGWSQFKLVRTNPRGGPYVIDVLNEEPDVVSTDQNANHPLFRKMMAIRYSALAPELDSVPARGEKMPSIPKQFVPRQGSLPERIRINSTCIVSILSKIIGGPVINPTRPLVIVRPFKALAQHEHELLAWAQKLELKYPDESHSSGVDQQETERPDLCGDNEQGNEEPGLSGNEQPENQKPGFSGEDTTESDDGHFDGLPTAHVSVTEGERDDGARSNQSLNQNSRVKPRDGVSQENRIQGMADWDPSDSRIALEHLRCLLEFIDTEIHAKIQQIENARSPKVYFSDIWHLFKPGDEVIEQAGRQVYRVLNVQSMGHRVAPPWASWGDRTEAGSKSKTPLTLTCVCIDFDGLELGPVQTRVEISRFDGQRLITSLPVYPLRFYSKPDVRSSLIARGKMFPELISIKHVSYSGLTLDTRDDIDGQVVIDFEEAISVNRTWKPVIENLLGLTAEDPESKELCDADCCLSEIVLDDFYVERNRHEEFMASLIPQSRDKLPSLVIYPWSLNEIKSIENRITDSEYLIMSHRVFGFVLHTRKWANLDLTNLTYSDAPEIKSGKGYNVKDEDNRDSSFDQLVLPPGHKDLVKSLISQHFRDKESAESDKDQTDIVRGKGRGLILLLHGAPGVGKTSTAECVASYFRKPLFHITCGDLGIWAKDVENTLETNFALANRWGCILLLDEADVFLASRTPTDHLRNSMVSVFLRVLEYYAGILFLTTNRVGDFDEAFASRVHMSLYYPPLDLDSTQEVFGLNLERIRSRFSRKNRSLNIKQFEIGGFVTNYWQTHPKARWNGRQIRNACQTALALAEFEAHKGNDETVNDPNAAVHLQVKHFQTVADAYLGFMVYMKDIYGVDADERAKEKFLRAGTSGEDQPNPLTTRGYPNSSINSFPGVNIGRPGRSMGAAEAQQQYGHSQPGADPSTGFPVAVPGKRPARGYFNASQQSSHYIPDEPEPSHGFQKQPHVWQSAGMASQHDMSLRIPVTDANMTQYSAQLTPPPSSMHPHGAYPGQDQPGTSGSFHNMTTGSGRSAPGWIRNGQSHPG